MPSVAPQTFCRTLGLDHPIIQAPMAGDPAKPELVLAVAKAGGLGSLGAGYLSLDQMRGMIRTIKAGTDKPYNINLFAPAPTPTPTARSGDPEAFAARLAPYHDSLSLPAPTRPAPAPKSDFADRIAILLEERVPIFSFTFGLPEPSHIAAFKEIGTLLIGTATTVAEGKFLEAAGIDMVVAQGFEAGGHRGSFLPPFADEQNPSALVGSLALIPAMADALSIPVLAAGGIGDGRAVKAALILGAQAAVVGTAFLATEECAILDAYKDRLINTPGEDTALTCAFSGKPARGILNGYQKDLADAWQSLPPYPLTNSMTSPMRKAATAAGHLDMMSLWSGQAASLAQKRSVAALMAELVSLL